MASSVSVSISLTYTRPAGAAEEDESLLCGLTVRLLASWAACSTTPVFGSGELSWAAGGEGGAARVGTYRATLAVDLSADEGNRLLAFNKEPHLTAVLLKEGPVAVEKADPITGDMSSETVTLPLPVAFCSIDCSILTVDSSRALSSRSQAATDLGLRMDVTVAADAALLSKERAALLEPVILDLQQLGGFPMLPEESFEEAFDSAYIYGDIDFGGVCRRTLLARPFIAPERRLAAAAAGSLGGTGASGFWEERDELVPVGVRLCLLPGLVGAERFKESLRSTTFSLQLHREDLQARCFHTRNRLEYGRMCHLAGAAAAAEMGAGDMFLLGCVAKALRAAGQVRSHGSARFRLEELLASSVDLLEEFARLREGRREGDDDVVVRQDMLLEVRLAKPSKPEHPGRPADISLRSALSRAAAEELSRADGTLQLSASAASHAGSMRSTQARPAAARPRHEQFFDCGTRLVMTAELRRKLQRPAEPLDLLHAAPDDAAAARALAITPFTRMVFVFKYDDDATLLAINTAVSKVNRRALPNIQGSLRSYSLADEELRASEDGSLDVITGFSLIDDEVRLVVLEGLAGAGMGMYSIYADIPRQMENSSKLKILGNPQVLFPRRLYPAFGPDLKRIRVRDRLKLLVRRPELYNRRQVDEVCFAAADAAMQLRRAVDLLSTKELGMYPSSESLGKFELLYGEAISRADLDGLAAEETWRRQRKEAAAAASKVAAAEEGGGSPAAGSPVAPAKVPQTNPRLLPTDSHNPAFEQHLRTRPRDRIDHIGEQEALRQAALQSAQQRAAAREQQDSETLVKILGPEAASKGKIHTYSQQALNFRVLNFSDLRQRLSTVNDATYTFSADFVSQTVCVVDEDVDRKKIAAEKKSHWLTSKGFQYPKAKTLQDLITHPKRPTDVVIEDLREPWQGDRAPAGRSADTPLELLRLEAGYNVRVKGGGLFGSLEAPAFAKPFQLQLVGDRRRLPRGGMTRGEAKDPAAMRSVHLGGEGQALIIEQAAQKEKDEWLAKVVVDTPSMRVGGFVDRDKVLQFQRTRDILDAEPQRLALRHLRSLKSHSGKDLGYSTAPLSLMQSGPYVQNAARNALQRSVDKSKWVTAALLRPPSPPGAERRRQQEPEDFRRFISSNANAAKILTVLSKRSISQLQQKEKVGARWGASGQAGSA